MVSIDLAWRLFSAIDFTRTRLLLIGDHQQLPPVGAGNLLRDLLHRAYIPVCVLDQVIRQAGTLKENAAAILEGRLAPTAPGSPGVPRPWYVVDSLKAPEAVVDALCLLLREKLPALGFDIVRDVQIITPYRKGPLGAERLNIEVQRVVQQARYGATPPPVREGGRPTLQVGDKVMQTRNNYTLDVMNGAIGRVEAISAVPTEDGSRRVLLIDFDGTHVQVPLGSDLERDLTLAYVTTIHKAQGSEFPCVIAILHRQHGYMLHRNLLYTAVTRARQTAILLGDRTGMGLALSTTTVDDRRTWLSIWGACRKKGGIVHA
jgi:exodeoxyribonuclease V alpha subunit